MKEWINHFTLNLRKMAKSSLQEKLQKRRQEIKDRSAAGTVVFIKEGTLRIRILPTREDEDWSVEATHFYLGNDVKGVYSRAAIGEDCPILDKYHELKDSNKADDKDLAKQLVPRIKYLVPALVYEDDRGKSINEKDSGKLVQLPTGIYLQMVDLFLDPDLGDFTDPETGYDLKIKRTGKGKQDTEYTLMPLPSKPIPKGWEKPVDPMKIFTETVLLSYDECENKLAQFLANTSHDAGEDDEDEKPRPKRDKVRKKTKRD